jgi:tripeptidyl-peptidase-1
LFSPSSKNGIGLTHAQYTVGLATGVPVTFLTVGGGFTKAVLDTTTYLAGVAAPPSVITTSYGGNEASFSRSDAQKICAGYMALGARGISVIYASGDGGVRGGHDVASQCTNNTFLPVFPASCPYGEHTNPFARLRRESDIP